MRKSWGELTAQNSRKTTRKRPRDASGLNERPGVGSGRTSAQFRGTQSEKYPVWDKLEKQDMIEFGFDGLDGL